MSRVSKSTNTTKAVSPFLYRFKNLTCLRNTHLCGQMRQVHLKRGLARE